MRRIAVKTEAPTEKTELIHYLSERIKQAEVFVDLPRMLSTTLRNYCNARLSNEKKLPP